MDSKDIDSTINLHCRLWPWQCPLYTFFSNLSTYQYGDLSVLGNLIKYKAYNIQNLCLSDETTATPAVAKLRTRAATKGLRKRFSCSEDRLLNHILNLSNRWWIRYYSCILTGLARDYGVRWWWSVLLHFE